MAQREGDEPAHACMHSCARRVRAWRRCPGARATTNRRWRCLVWCAYTARSNASPFSRRLVRRVDCMLQCALGIIALHLYPCQVIKQTKIYASSRGGRLSVFWGDQIFVPTKSVRQLPRAPHPTPHTTSLPDLTGARPSMRPPRMWTSWLDSAIGRQRPSGRRADLRFDLAAERPCHAMRCEARRAHLASAHHARDAR